MPFSSTALRRTLCFINDHSIVVKVKGLSIFFVSRSIAPEIRLGCKDNSN